MPTITTPRKRLAHHSDRLARGEVTDFETATVVYRDAVRQELALMAMGADGSPPEDGYWAREIEKAAIAARIYADEMAHAKTRTVNALRAAGLTEWGDALESGSYEGLAL